LKKEMTVDPNTGYYDVAVLGGGPGGFAAAIRAAQLGLNTALIARKDLAGLSLRRGRLPTMALIESARALDIMQRAEAFGIKRINPEPDWEAVVKRARTIGSRVARSGELTLAKWKIKVVKGTAQIQDASHIKITDESGEHEIVAENIVIAVGAEPKSLPGVEFVESRIISPRQVITLDEIPRRLLIVGAGPIGIEFAYIFHMMNSGVTVIEREPQALPGMDEEIASTVQKVFQNRGIRIITSARLSGIDRSKEPWHYFVETGGQTEDVYADLCIVLEGRAANIEGIGAVNIGIKLENGFIPVDDHMRTSIPGVYAVGDCIGPPLLAQAAQLEGCCAAETIAGLETAGVRYDNMPSCVYCHPEVATVGLSEAAVVERGLNYKIGKSYFAANGRAIARDDKDGLVKLIVNRDNDKILGAHIVGSGAPELIGQVVIGRKLDMTAGILANTSQPHPGLSETLAEAAAVVTGTGVVG